MDDVYCKAVNLASVFYLPSLEFIRTSVRKPVSIYKRCECMYFNMRCELMESLSKIVAGTHSVHEWILGSTHVNAYRRRKWREQYCRNVTLARISTVFQYRTTSPAVHVAAMSICFFKTRSEHTGGVLTVHIKWGNNWGHGWSLCSRVCTAKAHGGSFMRRRENQVQRAPGGGVLVWP